MPFRSEKQRKYLLAKHPTIAKRWTGEYGSEPQPKKKKSLLKKKRCRKSNKE